MVQIFFGCPAIVAAILLSIAGVWLKKPALLIAPGVVCVPLLLIPVCELAAAYTLVRGFNKSAGLWIAPLLITATLLAYTVLT
jgi:hypothetical protein